MAIARICSVEGCGKKHSAHSYCMSHRMRWKLHGDPLAGRPPNGEPSAWIERNKDYDGDGCLIWPFARHRNGYAKLLNGSGYRTMCEAVNGPPPTPHHEAAHSCGRGKHACVHPRHLRWATKKENSADRVAHNTYLNGDKIHNCRLTLEDVRRIRAMNLTGGYAEIGKSFGVRAAVIGNVVRGKTWRGSWGDQITTPEPLWTGRNPKPVRYECFRGHPLNEENTYMHGAKKVCRVCRRRSEEAYRLRKRRATER